MKLTPPLARLSIYASLFGVLVLILASLNGCTNVAGTSPSTLVRVIDASNNAPALDAYVSSVPIADNIVGPSISNYAFLGPGAATVKLDAHGTNTVLAQVNGTFAAGAAHSIYLTDQRSTFTADLLTDQSAPAPVGFVSFRFVQQATATGPVDVYLLPDSTAIADAKPLLSSLAPDTVTPYMNIPAGTYQLAIASAGTTKGAYTGTSTAFIGGQVRTVLIMDQHLLTTPPVSVLVADDVN
jgi:Domain of unknown function (DUF4397)